MKIYHTLDDFPKLTYPVVTSGTFDGVHLGHQKILRRIKEIARQHSGETIVTTFWPHPRLVLKPDDQTLKLLNTFEEKADLLQDFGIDHLVRIPFTKEFSQTSSADFIKNIIVGKLGTRKLVIGYDHHFGKNREGSFDQLNQIANELGFEVEEIPRQDIDHLAVSSSKIRSSLESGDVESASHLLGRPYSLSGRIVRGDRLGSVLGYPTANIDIDSHHKLVPGEGIYACTVEHESKTFGGMLYIGNRPTVNGSKRSIEVNIFSFNKDIYGESLKVNFIRLLRPDSRFQNLEELRQQLGRDKVAALSVLQETKQLN